MGNNEDDNYIIHIKTVQSGAFRILIEALKEILTDTNIIFDETGMKLIATDSSKIVLIHNSSIFASVNIITSSHIILKLSYI